MCRGVARGSEGAWGCVAAILPELSESRVKSKQVKTPIVIIQTSCSPPAYLKHHSPLGARRGECHVTKPHPPRCRRPQVAARLSNLAQSPNSTNPFAFGTKSNPFSTLSPLLCSPCIQEFYTVGSSTIYHPPFSPSSCPCCRQMRSSRSKKSKSELIHI